MNHLEGGWPKEINFTDEEIVARYRRRVEKDDNWAPKIRQLSEVCNLILLMIFFFLIIFY